MTKLLPKIGLRAAIILVVSAIVGSGVFKKITPMSTELGSPLLIVLCWVLAGIISLAGALSTAEMASMYPDSGGEYAYYKKIYGRFFAFLYGWGSFSVTRTASVAALAYIFSQSFNTLIPLPEINLGITNAPFQLFDNFSVKLLASFLIIVLSYINFRGIQWAEGLSRSLTFLMFAAVTIFIIFGLTSEQGSWQNLTQKSTSFDETKLQGWGMAKAMIIASLGAFWGYEGWNNIGFIGEEVKNPQRNLPLSLGIGTGIVILIYVLLNTMYSYVLPVDFFIQLHNSPNKIAAVEVADKFWGQGGQIFIACLILVTTLNASNSTIMTSSRVLYAMARNRLFFKQAASVHPVYKTPDMAILLQAIWAIMLIWSGSFDQLTDMLIFASFIFYGSTALGVIIMRYKHPEIERKYKVVGYPFVPILFVLFCILLFFITIYNQPKEALMGLGLIAIGVPFYLFWNRTKNSDEA